MDLPETVYGASGGATSALKNIKKRRFLHVLKDGADSMRFGKALGCSWVPLGLPRAPEMHLGGALGGPVTL